MLWYGYECWSIGITLMESILNQQQTIHNAIVAAKVAQQYYLCDMYDIKVGGYT